MTTTTATATTTTAAAQRWLGGYDHGNGYDHDCCGSTTAAITTLAMVTIATAMATIAEPMGVLNRPPPGPRPPLPPAYRVTGRITVTGCRLDNRVSVRFQCPALASFLFGIWFSGLGFEFLLTKFVCVDGFHVM